MKVLHCLSKKKKESKKGGWGRAWACLKVFDLKMNTCLGFFTFQVHRTGIENF